jgi:hypothetical protein
MNLCLKTFWVRDLWSESAGLNRHIVGDERALRKRRSDSILASSLGAAST